MTHHPHGLVQLYLGWHACTALGFGLELLLAPRELVTGPATTAVYGIAGPPTWGLAFIALSALCAAGGRWPRQAWRVAVIALVTAQTLWALALFAPLIVAGRTNLLASAPWISLAVTTALVARYTHRQELGRHQRQP